MKSLRARTCPRCHATMVPWKGHCTECFATVPSTKYHAVGVRDIEGRYFPSKGEAARANVLQLMERAGSIKELKFHPSVEIFPGLNWKLDSTYREGGEAIWEDFKGVMTAETRLKIKIWTYTGPGPLRIVKQDPRTKLFYIDKEYRPLGLEQLGEDLKACTAA